MIGLIGKKIGMTQIFDASGKVMPVTVIQVGPCRVVCKRTIETNGYEAVQLGYEEVPEKRISKPEQGHLKKCGSPLYRHLKEFRPSFGQDITQYNVGDELNAGLFGENETVTVSSKSKGRGFTGVMKRHGFAGFEQSHGVHESFRGPGSIGQCGQPSRVFKGVKMAGQHGNKKVTTRHLKVAKVDVERGLVMIIGAVPGARNGLVTIHKES